MGVVRVVGGLVGVADDDLPDAGADTVTSNYWDGKKKKKGIIVSKSR